MTRLSAMILLTGIIAGGLLASAQGPQATPPTIIAFSNDVPAISLADAEAGQTQTTLSWHTLGVTGEARLVLEHYTLNEWVSLLAEDETLPASGQRTILIQHPLNFGPPTYRLTILDGDAEDGETLAERVLTIPYTQQPDAEPPTIRAFVSDMRQVDANELSLGTARVTVAWQVSGRTPATNLVFEQVLPDGSAVTVELPRPNLWIASAGEGPLAPVLPQGSSTVRLRLSLVDLLDGRSYGASELNLAVVGTVLPTPTSIPPRPTFIPTLPPTPVVTPLSRAQIIAFTVTPGEVDRGGAVEVRWDVRNAQTISIWRLNPVGQIADFITGSSLAGSWSVTLPDYHVDSATFMLNATDASNITATASATVRVRCPLTYFFGTAEGLGCPLAEAVDVQAAFQSFERGYMVWRGDTRQIYVLYGDGRASLYQDTWAGEEITIADTPPGRLIPPARGFGKLWVQEPAVRSGLGWGTAPEQSYTMRMQRSGAYRYAPLYFTWPDGQVVALVEGTWEFLDAAG